MIKIGKSPTADSRTCDYTKVTKEQLIDSSENHIIDVEQGIRFFIKLLRKSAINHDFDKIENIDNFYHDFQNGFETKDWLYNHYKINRHHLNEKEGVPDDVNLVDVIEYITDCVMAGMARKGEVSDVVIDNDVLQKAFKNTVELLTNNVELEG